jgi:hypothetical protein
VTVLTTLLTVAAKHGPIGGDDARRAAARELAKQAYRQHQDPLLLRILNDVLDWISRHLNPNAGGGAGANWGLLILVGVLLLFVGLLIWRYGIPSRTVRGGGEPELRLGTGTVRGHTSLADRYASEGRYAEAVRERLRAIVRSLEERGLLDPRPGRTVTEIVATVRRSLPDATAQLRVGAQLFSDIWYGSKKATSADDATMREVQEAVVAAKPSTTSEELVSAGWAMPGEATTEQTTEQDRPT